MKYFLTFAVFSFVFYMGVLQEYRRLNLEYYQLYLRL